MTITSSNNRDQYTGNGANTAFTYTFKIFDEDDIQVYAGDTLQTITTHYTVSGVGNPAGGTVTFLVAPANGVVVTLVLDEPFTQEIDYVDGDDFPASAHEEGLDRSVSRDLTLSERISRSLLLPPETTITDLELPTPVADNVLGWNGAATALENKVAATSYLPSPTPAGSMLRVNSGLTGYELRTPTQVRGDISAAVSGANGDITSLTVITALNTGAFAGFRNAIINGNFNIWQRGTSFSSPASSSYTADRWWVNYDGTGAFTVAKEGNAARIDNANAEGYQFKWNQTGAIGGGCTFRQIRQKIEKVSTFAGKTVNLSFKMWAATGSGNFSVTYSQNFGTGGAPSTAVTGTILGSTALTNTGYTQHTVSVAIPSIVGKTLGTNNDDSFEVVFQLPITGTYDIRLMDVQLEQGAVKTEFEQRPFVVELAMCQRYYEKSFNQSIAPAQNTGSLLGAPTGTGQVLNQRFGCYVPFKVTKFTAPTITTYSPNAASANWQTNGTTPTVAVATIGDNGFYVAGTTAVSAGNDYAIHWQAVAEL